MKLMTLKRIIVGGWRNFVRSGLISFATVLIMTVTLSIIGGLIFLSAILTNTLTVIQDKVDVNVYFVTTAPESEILEVKTLLETLPEVRLVTYTSREDALTMFREKHAADDLTLQALNQLGDNPLGATLAIKAKDPAQYEGIVKFLSNSEESEATGVLIDRINYYQNKSVIDRLTGAIAVTEKVGVFVVILFAFASIIIAFSTIRLAIYSARDEITVMRLVGASNMYIRGPFIVAGIISGILAALVALALFYPVAYYAGQTLSVWLGGFNIFNYYVTHFVLLFSTLVLSGIVLGAIASYVAVRRYLHI